MSETRQAQTRLVPVLLAALMLLTLAGSVLWSAHRLMWNDEFLCFYTDRAASIRGVIATQLHGPLSLDPPTFHLLVHACMRVFGQGALAVRFPSLCGFLLLELSLFFFLRRLAGPRAALIAVALPLLTASVRYSVEGRPYGLLLGLYAAALLCWQTATRAEKGSRKRTLALCCLTLSIWLALTSHYFGVLILLPLAAGELVRTAGRKRLDWPMLASLLAGMAAVVTFLPFQPALKPYRSHYFKAVGLHDVLQGYRELFVHYIDWPASVQRIVALAMVLAVAALFLAAFQRFRQRPTGEPTAEWAAIASLALLPFAGFLIGVYVTHVMELRYVIATLIAFVSLFALVIERRLRNNTTFAVAYTAVLALVIANYAHNIVHAARESNATLASLNVLPASCSSVLATHPGEPIYTQTPNDFYIDQYYAPTPELRARFVLLYDEAREVKLRGHNTNAVSAHNMPALGLRTMPWSQVLQQHDPLVLIYNNGWEWVPDALAADGIRSTDLGPCFRGELVRIATSVTSK